MTDRPDLQEILEDPQAQRENLREFIDKLVSEGYTVGDSREAAPSRRGGRTTPTTS